MAQTGLLQSLWGAGSVMTTNVAAVLIAVTTFGMRPATMAGCERGRTAGCEVRIAVPGTSDSTFARVCDWEGWLPPAAGRIRYRSAHPLTAAAESVLRAQLSSANEHQRDAAARALGAGRDSATVSALMARAREGNQIVRDGALRSLGRIGSLRAEGVLIEALNDTSKHIRQAAAWSLGQLESRGASSALLRATHDPEEQIRAEAAWALGMTSDVSVLPRLREMGTDANDHVRVASVCATGWLGGEISGGVRRDSSAVLRAAVQWARARRGVR